MPYGIRRGGGDCRFEVYKKTGGGTEGSRVPGGCHPTNDEALGHQRALTVREKGLPPKSELTAEAEAEVAEMLGLESDDDLVMSLVDDELVWSDGTNWGVEDAQDKPVEQQSPAQRKQGLRSGERFPMNNCGDVGKAIRAVGRAAGGESGRNQVRKHIIGKARSLGCSDQVPDNWNSDGTLKQTAGVASAAEREAQAELDLAALEPRPGEHFHAVMHRQGKSTGRRTFTNLRWRDPPFAYHWQKGSSAHGGTPITVAVGLVDRVVPVGDDLHSFGHLDLDGSDGREYGRRLVAGFERWVSIGLDEQPYDREDVFPDDDDGEDAAGNPFRGLFEEPEQVLIDGGTIGELTGTSIPAQADAEIEPTPELAAALASETVSEITSNGGTVTTIGEAALPPGPKPKPPVDGECPDGWTRKGGMCMPPADGDEEAAGLEIEMRGGTITVLSGREPEPVPGPAQGSDDDETFADRVEALTAAAYRIEIPELPPASWFDAPVDVEIPGAFCITDEGRIYGILAPLHTGHRAFAAAGRRLTVPHGNVDYSRFLGGEALTREGRLSGVGPVTMDCRHASRFRSDHDVAPDHYENSCSVFAKIRVGETPEGLPWVAGALEPGVRPEQLSRALACRLSGDWQPHPDRPGWDELIAALLVPSPGFASGRTGPTVTRREGALVASSVPVRHVETVVPSDADRRAAFERMAAEAGSTEWAVRARRINRRAGAAV